jgi:hypothetical protein
MCRVRVSMVSGLRVAELHGCWPRSPPGHYRIAKCLTYQQEDPRRQRDGAEDAGQRFLRGQRHAVSEHGGGGPVHAAGARTTRQYGGYWSENGLVVSLSSTGLAKNPRV